jgi:predicted esterase
MRFSGVGWLVVAAALPAQAFGGDLIDQSLALVYDDGAGNTLPYRLFRPPGFEEPEGSFPLVLFLHGAGERGDDNVAQVSSHIDGLIRATQSERFSAFLLAPQVPLGEGWSNFGSSQPAPAMELTLGIIEELKAAYAIDASRLYVTGLSMGGFGTWDVIAKFPEMFAAAAPMSGGGDPGQAGAMRGVPIWAFHGSADTTVPVQGTRLMVDALTQAGGSPIYSETSGGHIIWGPLYEDPSQELYPWMFEGLPPAMATLVYDPRDGNVKVDARSAPGGSLSSFLFSGTESFVVPEEVVVDGVPQDAASFFSFASSTVLSFNGSGEEVLRGVADLGDVLPPGLDFLGFSAKFRVRVYQSPLTGEERRPFRVVIAVPEPLGMHLGWMGLGVLALAHALRRT